MNKDIQEAYEAAKIAHAALDDKMGQDIKVLDIHEMSVLSDMFVIANGNNVNQAKAMADEVERKLLEKGIQVVQVEGYQGGNWILLDFGCIIVHIFGKADRQFYNLEKIWANAPEVQF